MGHVTFNFGRILFSYHYNLISSYSDIFLFWCVRIFDWSNYGTVRLCYHPIPVSVNSSTMQFCYYQIPCIMGFRYHLIMGLFDIYDGVFHLIVHESDDTVIIIWLADTVGPQYFN